MGPGHRAGELKGTLESPINDVTVHLKIPGDIALLQLHFIPMTTYCCLLADRLGKNRIVI